MTGTAPWLWQALLGLRRCRRLLPLNVAARIAGPCCRCGLRHHCCWRKLGSVRLSSATCPFSPCCCHPSGASCSTISLLTPLNAAAALCECECSCCKLKNVRSHPDVCFDPAVCVYSFSTTFKKCIRVRGFYQVFFLALQLPCISPLRAWSWKM